MSYADFDRRAATRGWLIFGWVNIVAIPLLAIIGSSLLWITLSFCDAPGICPDSSAYLLVSIIVPAMAWIALLVALIRRRHLVAPLMMAMIADLLAVAVVVLLLSYAILP